MGLSYPHTVHCAPDSIMISTVGDGNLQNQGVLIIYDFTVSIIPPTGNFLLLDTKTFEPKGKWPIDGESTKFGYDFWFQLRHNVQRGGNAFAGME